MYIYIPRARVCCSCCCVYLTVSCQHKAHTERRLFFPNNVHIKRREGKKCKNFSKTEMNSFFQLSVRVAFEASKVSICFLPFFLFFVCLFFPLSLSLSRLLFRDSSTSSQKHASTKISSDPGLSLSLSSDDDEEEEDAEERGGVAFASSLICASFFSFWSSEERKRKARERE